MRLFGRPKAVVASAAQIRGYETQYVKRLQLPWQLRALSYYDEIGEIRYASHFYARQLARVRFYPALLQDDGTTKPVDSGPPVEILDQIQDPAGGRSRLQYDYGRLMFVTGEGVLFATPEAQPTEFRFLWRDEVQTFEDGHGIRLQPYGTQTGGIPVVPEERGKVYRLWTPHPRHSDLADSPLRPIIDICEELLILSSSVRATALSRMTNGILAVPSEISPAPDELGTDDDPESNVFLRNFVAHIQGQIDQPATAAAKAPFLLEAAYEYLDRVRWIQTHDPQTDYMERDLRLEAIKRMALGMDMPPEVLLGMTDANHWTAKQVQHDMWRSHGIAVAERFADDLNAAYLRPALEEDGYAEADRVVIAYDDSQVVISPDRSTDADNALDRIAIGFEGYRELKGIPESMAPTEEEKDFLAAIKVRDPGLLAVSEGIEPQQPARGPTPAPSNGNVAQEGPPEPVGARMVSRQETRTAAILGAGAMALRQCRALAGARLRDHVHECGECQERVKDVPRSMVAATLTEQDLAAMGARSPEELVKGGSAEFRGILNEWGVRPADAAALCQRLETYAAATLFQAVQPDLPPGYASLVEAAQELSLDALGQS